MDSLFDNEQQNLDHQSSSNHPDQEDDKKKLYFSFLSQNSANDTSSFLSKRGLAQDIVELTGADPDIPLQIFYAFYHTLWPQIQKQEKRPLKDAWTDFLGSPQAKGILTPPENLMNTRNVEKIITIFTEETQDVQLFVNFDRVNQSIMQLKELISENSQITFRDGITKSLELTQQFYQNFRSKVGQITWAIIKKNQQNISSLHECNELISLLEPKAVMIGDIFTSHWAYRIPRSQALQMLSMDEDGKPLPRNSEDPANHRVTCLNRDNQPCVYFKANGNPIIQPEKEFMFSSFFNNLLIPAPHSGLLVLTEISPARPESFYAVQASEAVIGDPADQAIQTKIREFDKDAFARQVIGAILTNPTDGSFQNYKYHQDYKTLISIDNDNIFEQEIIKNQKVEIKSILYLLTLMDSVIPNHIKTFYSTLDPQVTILAWLRELADKNKSYDLLRKRLPFQRTQSIFQRLSIRDSDFSLSDSIQTTVNIDEEILQEDKYSPYIQVSERLICDIEDKLWKMRESLQKPNLTLQQLFNDTSPFLGKYFHALRQKSHQNPKEAFDILWTFQDDTYLHTFPEPINSQALDKQMKDPALFSDLYKKNMLNYPTPLDRFLKGHRERLNKKLFSSEQMRKQLQLLSNEGLTDSVDLRDMIDFFYELKAIEQSPALLADYENFLHSIPNPELKWLLDIEEYFPRPQFMKSGKWRDDGLCVKGAFMKSRIIHNSITELLFDFQGNLIRSPTLTGRGIVSFFPIGDPLFYFKQDPEWPGYEYASTLFMKSFGISHLAHQDLLIINPESHPYPLLLTEAIKGSPVQKIWENNSIFSNLDPHHTGLLILSTMLLNPEDGKEDNFILSPDGKFLIPIDNDHSFLPGCINQKKGFWNMFTTVITLQTKTLLFCLDQMMEHVPESVRQHVLSINMDEFLINWLEKLVVIQEKYQNLVDPETLKKFLDKGTSLRIPFYQSFIQNLHWKAHQLQNLLRNAVKGITPFDILKQLDPYIAHCYTKSFLAFNTVKTRFKNVTQDLYYKGSLAEARFSVLNTKEMIEIINISQDELGSDAAYFKLGPLDTLEELNNYFSHREERIRLEEAFFEQPNQNERTFWRKLFSSKKNSQLAKELKEFFENPKDSLEVKRSDLISTNFLSSLISQNPHQGLKIRFLSFPDCPNFTHETLDILKRECPNLEYLNVSGCLKLDKINAPTGTWPLLSRLEANNCLNLKEIYIRSPLKVLRVQTSFYLKAILYCSDFLSIKIVRKEFSFHLTLDKKQHLQLEFEDATISEYTAIMFCYWYAQQLKIRNNPSLKLHSQYILNLLYPIWPKLGPLGLLDAERFEKELNFLLLSRDKQVKSQFQNEIQKLGFQQLCQASYLSFLNGHIDIHDQPCGFGDREMDLLTSINLQGLKSIHLDRTNITNLKKFIFQTNLPHLEYACLSHPKIDRESLTKISRDWKNLQVLDISEEYIGINKLRELISAVIEHNYVFQRLIFSCNLSISKLKKKLLPLDRNFEISKVEDTLVISFDPKRALGKFNICIMGDLNTGKKSLLDCFANSFFCLNKTKTWIPNEIVYRTHYKINDLHIFPYFILHSNFLNLGDSFDDKFAFSRLHGLIFIYSVTDKQSFENLKQWFEFAQQHVNKDVPYILVGNKCDSQDKQVSTKDGQLLADEFKIPFYEISAQKHINIDHLFMKCAQLALEYKEIWYKNRNT